MKRGIAIILAIVLTLTSCGTTQTSDGSTQINEVAEINEDTTQSDDSAYVLEEADAEDLTGENNAAESDSRTSAIEPYVNLDTYAYEDIEDQIIAGEDLDLSDERLQRYIQDKIYVNTLRELDSDKYCIESIQTVYYSQEYIEQLAYNSKANIYFGYTQAELDEQFGGKKYVFTLDADSGETTVIEVESYEDHTTEKVLKNVAVGAGVILVCVTVSTVTAASAPAVNVIFAVGAATGKTLAISGAVYGGITAGIVQGYQTGNFTDALSAAAVGASEGFEWGAIIGATVGGSAEAWGLYTTSSATVANDAARKARAAEKAGEEVAEKAVGLTMNEVARIQRDSKYPLDVIRQFTSWEEYSVYKGAGLYTRMIDGKLALVRDIDWGQTSMLEVNGEVKEVTNLWRAQNGYAPLDPEGFAYELHHINQEADSTLAILTESEHRGKGVFSILHDLNKTGVHNTEQGIPAAVWDATRQSFWKDLAAQVSAL